jgi:hypothetical protein
MITKEYIVEVLKNHSGYIDRSQSEQAVHEDNFQDVADAILSKLHQPTVSDAVCSTCRFNKSNTYHDKMWCRDCQQKNHYEQTNCT